MFKSSFFVCLLILGLLLAATQAHAGEPLATSKDAGYHRHDDWYLRLSYGVGAAGISAPGIDGTAISFGQSVAGGHSIAERLILFAEVNRLVGTVVELNSYEPYEPYSLESETLGLGVGLAYYTASNWYASIAVGTSAHLMNGRVGNQSIDRGDLGVTASALFGREWWTSARDGALGVGLQLESQNASDMVVVSAMLVGTITID